ncbi:DUF3239 domain-containing protein [Paludisphaera sp.]|uniref:DUF3239 domain-containing protein n=1 Tax=Paludisphaera sp. TaxID=2017432 RepID=UPI00301E2E1E
MSNADEHPYRGEEINGSSASIAPGVSPEFFHAYRHESSLRFLIKSAVVVLGIGAIAVVGGNSLRGVGGWAAGVGGYASMIVGGLLVLLGLLLAFFAVGFWSLMAHAFKNGLLTPAVVVSQEPTALAVLAEMGNGGRTYHGVRRLVVPDLPVHGDHLGTRVPCSSTFQPGEAVDRWAWFTPTPISHGTARPAAIEECFRRLGEEPFRRLESLVRLGLVPPDEKQVILLDENYQVLERLKKPD